MSNLISPVSYFINHIKQFQLLDNNLKKHKNASLVGVSGIGKTQLARMYAYENKYNYDIIWFFDCNLDVNGEFLKLARQLNKVFKANISEDTGLAKSEVIDYLKHQDKWLLIFDNLKMSYVSHTGPVKW
ncbi:MAG: ATP-binding protein [Rickettsiaceae bacterium]|nr:ATP-binding protein [Rickettsiaceae bacterium]